MMMIILLLLAPIHCFLCNFLYCCNRFVKDYLVYIL